MSVFFDTKYTVNGQIHRQDFYLPNKMAVRDEVVSLGGHVIDIQEKQTSGFLSLFPFRGLQMRILRGLRFHIAVDPSPGRALSKVYAQEEGMARQVLEPGLEVLRRGGDFEHALEKPGIFDHVVRSLMVAGERTGRIRESIEPALAHLIEKGKTKRLLGSAMGWLGMEFFTAIGVIFTNQFFYLPYVDGSMVQSMPPNKRAQMEALITLGYQTNYALMAITVLVAIGALFSIISFTAARRDPESPAAGLVQTVPVVRSYLTNMQVYETCSVAWRLLDGGVQIPEAIKTVRDMAWVVPVRKYWATALDILNRGKPLPTAMTNGTLLTKAERAEFTGGMIADDLKAILQSVSEERLEASRKSARRMIQIGAWGLGSFILTAFGVFVAIFYVQGQGMMSAMDQISSGL